MEFYIDNTLEVDDVTEPYNWTWDKISFSKHTVRVVAYDNAGNTKSAEIEVWKFF